MKRKTTFRAKALSGEWVQGNYIHSKRFEGCFNEYRIHDQDTGIEHDVDPETVGQYTGKDDMNGCKIFDGDIMQHKKPFETPFLVNWIDSECGYGFNDGTSSYVITDPSFTVIGNIHDNPELL